MAPLLLSPQGCMDIEEIAERSRALAAVAIDIRLGRRSHGLERALGSGPAVLPDKLIAPLPAYQAYGRYDADLIRFNPLSGTAGTGPPWQADRARRHSPWTTAPFRPTPDCQVRHAPTSCTRSTRVKELGLKFIELGLQRPRARQRPPAST